MGKIINRYDIFYIKDLGVNNPGSVFGKNHKIADPNYSKTRPYILIYPSRTKCDGKFCKIIPFTRTKNRGVFVDRLGYLDLTQTVTINSALLNKQSTKSTSPEFKKNIKKILQENNIFDQ